MRFTDARKLRRKARRAAEKRPGYEIPWEPISMETLHVIGQRLRELSIAEDAVFWERRHERLCIPDGKCDCASWEYVDLKSEAIA